MKTEKQEKVRPTEQELINIFLLYPGSPIITTDNRIVTVIAYQKDTIGFVPIKSTVPESKLYKELSLCLKPLSKITSEQKLTICKIEDPVATWTANNNVCQNNYGQEISFGDTLTSCYYQIDTAPGCSHQLCLWSIQQLQEWGYALPYKNWSVDDLVKFGIYKLID